MQARKPVARVLLVEDDRILAHVYARALVAAGFVVDAALDGAEGLERLLAGAYDVLVTDLCMPRMNGLDLLQEVRRVRPDVPVVFMTAEVDSLAYTAACDLGIVRFLLKPMTMEQLARAVESAASLRATLVRSAERRAAIQ
ncbi:MAG: response regulator [Myxococcota bacterium]|nr:response regulator [Myxococcota bacterium]